MSLHNNTGTRPKKASSLITDSGHKNSANSQSKLGYELTAAISFKIIVVTLIMLVVLPFTFLRVTDHGYMNYTRWLHQTLARDTQFTSTTQMTPIIDQYLNNMRMQPVVFGIAMPMPSTYYLVQFKVYSVYIYSSHVYNSMYVYTHLYCIFFTYIYQHIPLHTPYLLPCFTPILYYRQLHIPHNTSSTSPPIWPG